MMAKTVHIDKKWLKRLIISGCCIVLFITAQVLSHHISQPYRQRLLSERWSENEQYTELTLFFSELTTWSAEEVRSFRQDITEDYLQNAGFSGQEEEAISYVDACSFDTALTVKTEKAETETIITVTEGAYFQFQPMELLHGSYFWGQEDYTDLVVLDELLAWKLFGSSNVSGMTVTVDHQIFTVSGVVKEEGLYADVDFYGKKPRMYMQYSAYQKLIRAQKQSAAMALEKDRSSTGTEKGFTVYQLLLPEPVKNYGDAWVQDLLSGSDKIVDIQKQEDRFSAGNLFGILGRYAKRTLTQPGLSYPYWENAVRMAEDYAAMLWVLSILFLVFPLYTLLAFLYAKKKDIRRIFRIRVKIQSWLGHFRSTF